MNNKYYLTKEGAENMRIELEDMINVQRVEISERLEFAISQGDLSENADYHKAKEDQGFLEGKIQEYEEKLSGAVIIEDTHKDSGVVDIGSWVTIKEDDNPEERYQVVGATEANPRDGRISNESPIGSAVLGRVDGETITANTPGGDMKFKILKVE